MPRTERDGKDYLRGEVEFVAVAQQHAEQNSAAVFATLFIIE